jgi:hypothetical protein
MYFMGHVVYPNRFYNRCYAQKTSIGKTQTRVKYAQVSFAICYESICSGRISLGIIPEDTMRTAQLEDDYQKKSQDFAA